MDNAFRITDGKGFGITFKNGWSLSVQWGPGNYCDNYGRAFDVRREVGEQGSNTAECAAFNPKGEFVKLPGEDDDVTNRSSADDVLRFLNWVAAK